MATSQHPWANGSHRMRSPPMCSQQPLPQPQSLPCPRGGGGASPWPPAQAPALLLSPRSRLATLVVASFAGFYVSAHGPRAAYELEAPLPCQVRPPNIGWDPRPPSAPRHEPLPRRHPRYAALVWRWQSPGPRHPGSEIPPDTASIRGNPVRVDASSSRWSK